MATQGEEILARMQAGEAGADDELAAYCYVMFSKWVAYTFQSLGSTLKKDMVDLAVAHVWMVLPQYDGKGAFEGWARRVMYRKIIDELRKTHKWRETFSIDVHLHDGDSSTAVDHIAGSDPLPDEIVDQNMMRNVVLGVIRALPSEKERRYLWAYLVEHCSALEIAAREGIAAKNRDRVDVPLCRAKKKLFSKLKEMELCDV